jgi:DNA-binding NarL/FixJ family response regulator
VSGDRHAKRRPRLPFLVRVHALTQGESKITNLVVAGLRIQTPAEHLRISVNTPQDHFKVIFDKVEASEPPQAGGS